MAAKDEGKAKDKKKRSTSKPKVNEVKHWETFALASWLQVRVSEDDYAHLKAVFAKQQINALADLLALTDSDMKEMDLPIGIRNRVKIVAEKARGDLGMASSNPFVSATAPLQLPTPSKPILTSIGHGSTIDSSPVKKCTSR